MARLKAQFRGASIKMIVMPFCIMKMFSCLQYTRVLYFTLFLNIGNCVDQINGYNCQCQAGYTGINCDVNIDECQSSPCKKGKVQVIRVEKSNSIEKCESLRKIKKSL